MPTVPDSPTLQAMIGAATSGDWRTANHGTYEVEADPDQRIADCGTVDRARPDAAIMALAKALAEAVIRLREDNAEIEVKRDWADRHLEASRGLYSVACGEVDKLRAANEALAAECGQLRAALAEVEREAAQSRAQLFAAGAL